MSAKLGELLVANKLVTEQQLKTAQDTQKQIGGKLGTILIKLRYLTETQMAEFLGKQLKLPVLRLNGLIVQPQVSALVDGQVCEKHQVLPIRRNGEKLLVAAVDPMDLDAQDEMQFLTGMKIEFAAAARSDLIKAIDYYFHGKPCPELREAEKASGVGSGQHAAVSSGTPASPQAVLQALTELLIEKKVITRDELLKKVK